MIDIGFVIPKTGQYIMIIIGVLLILAGVILALVSILRNRKTNKLQEANDEIFNEPKEKQQDMAQSTIENTPRKRRSSKY